MKRILINLIIMVGILLLPSCEKDRTPSNHAPVASFIASITTGDKPLKVDFDASLSLDEDEDNLTYEWDLGDGNNSTGQYCTHTFLEVGSFKVTLTVTDEGGLQDQTSTTIRVNQPPDLFPISGNAQWVYHVSSTETENGVVSDHEEGTMYLVATESRKEDGIDYMTLRITGKRRYNENSLGDYIYLTHIPGNMLMVSRSKDESAKAMVKLNESAWKDYCMFFSDASDENISLSSSTVNLNLGNFETFKVRFHKDNFGESFVSTQFDITEEEFLSPDVGLVYRKTSRYVNMRDCFTCPVYGGSSEVTLTGYHITLTDGSIEKGGSGYNMDNPYGGRLGLKTIWASVDIGNTSVYLDNEYVGYIADFFPNGIVCDQEGALNVFRPGGTSHLTAKSSKGYQWEGDINFTEGLCTAVELTLSSEKKSGNMESILIAH